jgi:hypothetical protein
MTAVSRWLVKITFSKVKGEIRLVVALKGDHKWWLVFCDT